MSVCRDKVLDTVHPSSITVCGLRDKTERRADFINMRPQLNDETDDEYFDDLIKLFDSEHDRVHFGSQATQDNGTMNISKYNHSNEDVTLEKDGDSTGIEDSDSENFSERDCLPLYIKLVDCSKFPWYYKKYTQQILEKVNISVSVSDSDSELDIENVDDLNDDCFIIDYIGKETNNQNNKHSSSSLPTITSKTTAGKKRREDIEIQKALSQKHSGTVDFKRNKGLIGMKITQKYVKETHLTPAEPNFNKTTVIKVTEKHQTIAKSSINASDKALNNIGKLFITPTVPKVNTASASNETEAKTYKSEYQESMADVLIDKSSVKFIEEKISEELVEHIITMKQDKKWQDILPDNKKKSVNFSTSLNPSSSPREVKNSSRTVKNIKNTTKYKKTRLKDFESKLLKLLDLESNKKETIPFEANNVDKNKNMNESVRAFENSFKIDNRYTCKEKKSTSQSDTIHQVANKPMLGNCNNFGSIPRTPIESTIESQQLNSEIKDTDEKNEATKPLKEVPLKCDDVGKSNAPITNNQSCSSSPVDTIQTSFPMSSNVYNNLQMNPIVSKNPIPFCFAHPTDMTSYVSNANNTNYSKNMSNYIISNSNEVASDQWTNIGSTINNKITPSSMTTVSSTQCKPNSIPNNYDKFINTYNLNNQNECSNKAILNHLNNGPSHNSYASAIILKPTQPKSISCGPRFNYPILDNKGPPQIPVRMQPRFYHNPYKTNHYRPPYNQEQRFIPRMRNCIITNNRFPAPHNNRCNSLYNSLPFPTSHTGWRMPNNFHKGDPRSECPRNFFAPRLPILELQTNINPIRNTKYGLVSSLDKIAKPMVNTQQDHSSRVLNTNEDPRHLTHSYKEDIIKLNTHNVFSEQNYDLVTSKTTMLELLDSETNNLKIAVNKDDNDIEKKLDDIFKTSEKSEPSSSKPEITINKDYRKDIERQNGYSPPILPIPTFERVLDQVKMKVQNQNQNDVICISRIDVSKKIRYLKESNKKTINCQSQKNVRKKDIKTNKEITPTNDFYNRVVSGKSKESIKKQEIKKISLEEYKKRSLSHRFEDYNYSKSDSKDSSKKRKIMYNKPKTGVDKYSTESDHGYDSDSTVILL
ncbi:unnamed protein product [Arctia plantaginis]|uniref:Uncharacterized protein n=1 Tax=Arctia plantaginis TaxID=874455 RepID=A0A8S1B391_ARCPL|nr:unnamed protein product [Arctia plantaginis]CAB3253887.1 unnamed protein product [Arctia plantaginis]